MTGAQEAFEIVKDSGKLKAKLKQLADAEASAQASHDKVKAKNKELFAEYDAKKAEMDKMVEDAFAIIRQAQNEANSAMRPVEKEKGELAKNRKSFERSVAKFEQDKRALNNEKEQFNKDKELFELKVNAFEKAVMSVKAVI